MNRVWLLVALLISLTVVGPAAAQDREDSVQRELDQAKMLYRDGRFDQAITTLNGVVAELSRKQDLQSREQRLADAHLLLGLSYFALREESKALDHFKDVIALEPNRTLDAEIYSPKLIGVFERARSEIASARPAESRGSQPTPGGAGGLVASAPTKAAPDSALLSGTKVRVRLRGAKEGISGHLSELNENMFALIGPDNLHLSFPREMITKLEVVKGRKGHWALGLAIGAGVGGVIGATEKPGCDTSGTCYTRGQNIGYGALAGGMIGALVGALVKTDQWAEVSNDRVACTVSPIRNGGIGVMFAW